MRLIFGILISLTFSMSAVQGQRLFLSDAVKTGLENNLSVRIADNRRQVQLTNADYAWGSFLPVISAAAVKSYSLQDVEQNFLDGRVVNRSNAKSENFNAVGSVTLRVFDGGAMFKNYDLSKATATYAELTRRRAVETVMADISIAYFDAVLQARQLEAYRATLELSASRLQLARDRYELGATSKVEFLTAKVDLNRDSTGLLDRQEAFRQAKIMLNRLLAGPPETEVEVDDTIYIGERLALPELTEAARQRNSDILLNEGNRQILDLEKSLVATERYPIIDLYADYGYTKSSSEAGFVRENVTKGWNYGATAKLNILTGFDQRRREQLSRINIANNDLLRTDIEAEVMAMVAIVFQSYQTGLQQARLEATNLSLARENYSLFEDRYRLGVATALELREAQLKILEANLRLDEALHQVKTAEIELARLSGQLLD